MKEATGEVSMTVIVIVAIAVIGGILAAMWGPIKKTISNAWGSTGASSCEAMEGCTWSEDKGCVCTGTGSTGATK